MHRLWNLADNQHHFFPQYLDFLNLFYFLSPGNEQIVTVKNKKNKKQQFCAPGPDPDRGMGRGKDAQTSLSGDTSSSYNFGVRVGMWEAFPKQLREIIFPAYPGSVWQFPSS